MLLLYKNVTPNNTARHYYCNFDLFLQNIETYKVAEIEKENYLNNYNNIIRINGNIFYDVTYIVDTSVETPKCYFVKSSEYVSGYTEFNLIEDYWAEYFYSLKDGRFIDIKLERGKFYNGIQDIDGIFDLQQTCKGIPVYTQVDIFNLTNVLIVFNCEYSYTNTTLFANESITTNKLLAIKSTVETMYEQIENIVNTYSIQKIVLENQTTQECVVTALYVIPIPPNYELDKINNYNIMFKRISENGALIEEGYLCNSFKAKRIEIPFTITVEDINKKYFFGTKANYLDLIINDKLQCNLNYIVDFSSNKITVSIYQGERSIDLTSNFEFNTTTNNGTFTQQEKTATALKNIFGIMSGGISTITGIASGNVPQIAGGTFQSIESINDIFDKRQGKVNYKNVDGLTTWWKNIFDNESILKCNPFYLITYETYEHYDISHMGFKYDYSIIGIEFLSKLTIGDFAYVKGDINITGIPIDANNYIKEKIKNGVILLKASE